MKADPIVVKLRQKRELLKISRRAMAERTGYSMHQIYCWENGLAVPTLTKLRDWCDALGISLEAKERADALS